MWAPRERSEVPVAVAVFTTDVTVRPFNGQVHNVVRWSEFGRGGHFAALEAPDLLTADVREFFRSISRLSAAEELAIIDQFCDPVIVMAEGSVLATGTMATLRARSEVVEAYLVG